MNKVIQRLNEFNKKSSLKQSKVIMFILVSIITMFLIWMFFVTPNYEQSFDKILVKTGVIVIVVLFVVAIMYEVLEITAKEFQEEERVLRPIIRQKFGFKQGEFIEVQYAPNVNEKELKKFLKAINKYGIKCYINLQPKESKECLDVKYFAKAEDEEIILIIKNNNGEIIKEDILNYCYFDNYYNPKIA